MFLSVSPGNPAQPLPRLCVEAEFIFTLAAEAGSGGLILFMSVMTAKNGFGFLTLNFSFTAPSYSLKIASLN